MSPDQTVKENRSITISMSYCQKMHLNNSELSYVLLVLGLHEKVIILVFSLLPVGLFQKSCIFSKLCCFSFFKSFEDVTSSNF